jgi:hypothetical protein
MKYTLMKAAAAATLALAVSAGASSAMADMSPETVANLPQAAKTTVMKHWPDLYQMNPAVWRLDDGDYRVRVQPDGSKASSLTVTPNGAVVSNMTPAKSG